MTQDHAPLSRELAGRPQHLLERIRLVRVVNDDVERLARVDRLEAAGHALDRFEAALDRFLPDLERPRRVEGAERILDVEAPLELELDPVEGTRCQRR